MKAYKQKDKNNRGPVPVILICLFLFALIFGLLWYFFLRETSTNDTSPETDTSINYMPPTEEEQNSANEQKQEIIENESENEDEETEQQTANVLITDAAQYDDVIEVRAFINNSYEDGTCTITFTQKSREVKKETPAYKDASTTICTNPLIKTSEFPTTGEWKVVVAYTSTNSNGVSDPVTVMIK